MPQSLDHDRQTEPENYDSRFSEVHVNIGGKIYCYLTVPYPGCTKTPSCDFCAFKGTGIAGLTFDELLKIAIVRKANQGMNKAADTLVFLNNGNALHPDEMDPEVILRRVPQAVAAHPNCKALEIEVSVADLLECHAWDKLLEIKRNLAGKELRVRLPIEYANNELLERHHKGVTLDDIDMVIRSLTMFKIPWVGYTLFGGVDMTSKKARQVAVDTGKYSMDRGARMVCLNGLFMTESMKAAQERTGQQLYIPTIDDLMHVLPILSQHAATKKPKPLIKVDVAEEDPRLNIVQYPYDIPANNEETWPRMAGLMRDFNGSQNADVLSIWMMQNQMRSEATRSLQ